MSTAETIRAWKDPQFRATLDVAPAHPAGQIEFNDPALGGPAIAQRGFRNEAVSYKGTLGAASTCDILCGKTKHVFGTKNPCC